MRSFFVRSSLTVVAAIGLACSMANTGSTGNVALVRAQGVEFLQVNGTRLDSSATAVVVISGRNELLFRWPIYQDGFKLPREYNLIMNAEAGKEYVITTHPKSGFLCAWPASKQEGIDFKRHSGCVSNQPS